MDLYVVGIMLAMGILFPHENDSWKAIGRWLLLSLLSWFTIGLILSYLLNEINPQEQER